MYTITVKHTSVEVSGYTIGDSKQIEKSLSVWDPVTFKYKQQGFIYHEDENLLLLPRGVDVNKLEKSLGVVSHYSYKPDPYESISVKLQTPPRDDIQRRCISYLIGANTFEYTKKYSQLLLDLQTGDGKTYITIAATTLLGYRTMIITHIDKIKKQWEESYAKMTDLDPKHICNLDSSKTIENVLKEKNIKYKVFLVNHGTINSYAKKYGWFAVSELFKRLKIGMKVYDEAHLNFENIIRIDLHTNTKKTIYLTATFERSDHTQNKLFKKCFSNITRFGSETKREKRKHVVYLSILYDSHPNLHIESSMQTARGFNKIRYSQYQEKCDTFYDALAYTLDYFKNVEGKMLVLSTKISTVEAIADFVKRNFKDKSVGCLHSKVTDIERDRALSSCDIICSTPKSAGTGVDIPGLRTVVMCESYSSKVQAEQVSGRLREYGPTSNTFHVELVDVGFRRVREMYENRLVVFQKKCVKLLSINLDDSSI